MLLLLSVSLKSSFKINFGPFVADLTLSIGSIMNCGILGTRRQVAGFDGMSETLFHRSNDRLSGLLDFLPILVLAITFVLYFVAEESIGQIIPQSTIFFQIILLTALLTLPGYVITKFVFLRFQEDFDFSEVLMLSIIFSMLLWMLLALFFAIVAKIDSLSIFMIVYIVLALITLVGSRSSKPISTLKSKDIRKLANIQLNDVLRLPELSLIIPILLGLFSSLIYFLGPSQWDPLFYSWRIERFTKLEDIEFTILAASQAEGFYALFVFLELNTGLSTLFWLQWSAIPFSLLTGLVILNIGKKLTDEPVAIWFLMIFAFLLAFSHSFIVTRFWASALAGIFFLFGLWVYLNADRFNDYFCPFLLFLSCLATALSHVFMGVLLGLVYYSTLLFSSEQMFSRENVLRTSSILLSLIFTILRVSFNASQVFSVYESYMQQYLNFWSVSLFILISFLGRYAYLLILNERNFSLPISAFFWLAVFAFALSALVLIPLAVFEDEIIELISFFIPERFSFKPLALKFPLLFFLLITGILALIWAVVALTKSSQNNKDRLLFSLVLTTSLMMFFLIWAHASGFSSIFYAFRNLAYIAIAIGFVMAILLTNFLHDQHLRFFTYFVVVLSLILSPSALMISFPMEGDRPIDPAEFKLTSWMADNLPYGAVIVVPHLRFARLLAYHTEGNLDLYANGKFYIYYVDNLTDLAETRDFAAYKAWRWYYVEYVYFLFDSEYDEIDPQKLTNLGLDIVKQSETHYLLGLWKS